MSISEGSMVLTTTSLQFPQTFLPWPLHADIPGIQFAQVGRRTEGDTMVVVDGEKIDVVQSVEMNKLKYLLMSGVSISKKDL